jgi:hypothetical protein
MEHREYRIVNGRKVERYANGAWYFEGSGTTPGADGAREVEPGLWFHMGSGVAVE